MGYMIIHDPNRKPKPSFPSSSPPTWSRESTDEKAILAVLRGATLRNLGRWDAAKAALKTGVLSVDRAEMKGGLKDDWTGPAAHYEMGVVCWMQRAEAVKAGDVRGEERWWYEQLLRKDGIVSPDERF